ncbi:cytochrome-c peroxidase [methane-oxidizing endosymbiont of Gigantopelta aegis]|uniref:cytochrome-c peroxidase n=1 Tax=methane-oxidizing endosymbiont of Gigantopelta aegis TaxID=2794938 RepID=UPI0018DD3C35|nr:cytochrome c peroxidase [methane-oxidizing endosymbiont of Gigantopelta aegis]
MKKKLKLKQYAVLLLSGGALLFSFEAYAHSKNSHSRMLPAAPENSDYYNNGMPNKHKVELGKLLFFDKVLSGNQNISCATCHHTLTDTGDGLSLPVGEGGQGLGMARHTGVGDNAIHARVPRNAPPVFNLGAREFSRMFYDGRLEVNPSHPSGFDSPAGDDLPMGLDNVLAAQAMFPVTSAEEMAGQVGENMQADAAAASDFPAVWEIIANRLRNIPEYVDLFKAAFPDEVTQASDITYVQAANAIAAFEADAWRFDNSPFLRFLKGDKKALSKSAKKGMKIFYSRKKANCASCHSGPFQTDHDFHAIAMPQIGPGKGDGFDGHSDFGRERVTGDTEDRFKFRTPTLSNIALIAPYGHDGAFNTLEAMVRHHLDPETSLLEYDRSQAVLPSRPDLDAIDFIVMDDQQRVDDIADANELDEKHLSEKQFGYLMDFLHALTDPAAVDLRMNTPMRVPSGLPVAD